MSARSSHPHVHPWVPSPPTGSNNPQTWDCGDRSSGWGAGEGPQTPLPCWGGGPAGRKGVGPPDKLSGGEGSYRCCLGRDSVSETEPKRKSGCNGFTELSREKQMDFWTGESPEWGVSSGGFEARSEPQTRTVRGGGPAFFR